MSLHRPQYGTWWIGAASGRAMLTRRFVNLVRIRPIQPMWWETPSVSVRRPGGSGHPAKVRSGSARGLTPTVAVDRGSPSSHTGSDPCREVVTASGD